MKKILLSIILVVFYFMQMFGQKANEEDIYLKVLDSLNAIHKFDFYQENLIHFDTKDYANNPTDAFEILDPSTYETIAQLGIDLEIEYDSINLKEAKLYKQRLNYPNGIYFIGSIKKKALHRNIKLENYINLENYPDLELLGELRSEIFESGKIGKYDILKANKIDAEKYKYAIKAYFTFSGIQWDNEKRYCVVECGYHYKSRMGGRSGGGFQAILKRINNSVEIVKMIGLWEE